MNSHRSGRSRLEAVFSEMTKLSDSKRRIEISIGSDVVLLGLEEATCQVLDKVAETEKVSLDKLCADILSDENSDIAPESRLRAYAIEYLRNYENVMLCEGQARRKPVSMSD
jgi:predicted DNA-binding ribbon-helix-helix protein